MTTPGLIENSVTLSEGVRIIARKEGLEVRRDLNSFTQEIVVSCIPWNRVLHLHGLTFSSR